MLPLMVLGCGQLKTLSRADALSPDDRLNYLILASLAPSAAIDYLNSAATDRKDFLGWFWQQPPWHDDTMARTRFHDRAIQARSFFGQSDLLGDDRVRTFIRYGPARRDVFEPKETRTETLTVVVPPAEIWTYDSLGLQFDFIRTGVPYKLVGQSDFGPGVNLPSLEPVDLGRDPPAPVPGAKPLGLAVALGRLGQQADSVEVEFHCGIPLRQIARSFGRSQPLIHILADFIPRGKGRRKTLSYWVSTRLPPDTASTRFAVGRAAFSLQADVYSVSVSAVTADGKAASTRNLELNLVDYVRRAQPASDIIFLALADSSFQSPQFEGLGWRRLVPLVEPSLVSGQTCYILYQLYNLGQDSTGRHRLDADYDFIEESSRQLAVAATPPRFIAGPGPFATVVERVHTMNLRPGDYLIAARVHDRVADRRISLAARLRILPR